ncbi:GIY-YIG nuclease family protein [Psychrobacter sp. CAM01]|uniref:GIY-YIG nuclease family protein n=1 Tax=Psychrobacter sp. CAM01 TaxID=3080335 RepID=UPI0029355ECC|nr:GIY-YIG nuclease family protein [Psychrobacter sp. CAM01]MDV2860728.1 GIY-YIG nuclease family protein [Psychrobacter sp. CAM01]
MNNWIRLGFLDESDCDFSSYNKNIGVYKGELDDELVYIGKATEINNGGFRKRLRDYTRESDSARNYPAGRKMFENKDKVIISVSFSDSVNDASIQERELIDTLNPKWNRLGTT